MSVDKPADLDQVRRVRLRPSGPMPWDSTREIASPAPVVWALLANLEHWPAWGTTVTAVDPAVGTVSLGLTGRVRTVLGVWLPFEITEMVEGESWGWRVAGIAATGHVVESTARGCRVTFTAPSWAPFYLPVLSRGLGNLERLTRAA